MASTAKQVDCKGDMREMLADVLTWVQVIWGVLVLIGIVILAARRDGEDVNTARGLLGLLAAPWVILIVARGC